MNPPGFRFAFLLAAAALLGGCASTDPTGSGQAGMTSSTGNSGGAGKADSAREKTEKSADKDTAQSAQAKASPKADDRCPPSRKVTGTSSKTPAKRVGAAETDARPAAAKKPPEETLSPEAALAKAVAEEKAYDQELRRRFGLSEDAKLGDLLSPEENKEAVRLHARTEAARRRLALTLESAPTASPETVAKPLKGIGGDGQAMAAAAPTTASLPAIPDASAPAAAKTPTALHLSDWILNDKTHQAWREKHLSKLAETKDGPPPEPEKK
jgi:hypothetical protein